VRQLEDPPRATASASRPANHGKAWTPEDDDALAHAFDAGRPIAELAEAHARSRSSIRQRLVKLGKLQP
jgi:hypothetical protein